MSSVVRAAVFEISELLNTGLDRNVRSPSPNPHLYSPLWIAQLSRRSLFAATLYSPASRTGLGMRHGIVAGTAPSSHQRSASHQTNTARGIRSLSSPPRFPAATAILPILRRSPSAQQALSICVSLCENGVSPEALASVVKELRREGRAMQQDAAPADSDERPE